MPFSNDLPENEENRLDALMRYHVLDTPSEAAFDDLARLAAYICQTPIALVSLLDETRQWFKARVGLDVTHTGRNIAFCNVAITKPHQQLLVPDTTQDERFANNPLVVNAPYFRAYAGAPLVTPDGFPLGTICVVDRTPREFTPAQQEALTALSRQVIAQLELRRRVADQELLVAAQERLMLEAIQRADRDPLTNLFNHRAFHNHLHKVTSQVTAGGTTFWPGFSPKSESSLAGNERRNTPRPNSFALAVLDIDNFKFFNDAYGHAVGDEVLLHVADALHTCCREEDIIARTGGDEFVVLMQYVDRTDAEKWARRLRQCASELSYSPADGTSPIPLRLSVGIALFPEDAATVKEALNLADKRAMQAKTDSVDNEESHEQAEKLRALLGEEIDGFAMIDALVAAVDGKDRYTRRHSEEVLRYTILIAEELGLSESEKSSLKMAALIHDVGKIGVPSRVLRRPGSLSDGDFASIHRYPVLGALLISAVPELSDTLDAVKYHHERWSGNGYPSGLRGEEIPLSARILAVADAYAAMTANRPYRKGMSHKEASEHLRAGAGEQWDTTCVTALLDRLESTNS